MVDPDQAAEYAYLRACNLSTYAYGGVASFLSLQLELTKYIGL